MQQFFTRLALFAGFATLFVFCKPEKPCHELTGRWTNHEGQTLSFQPGGKGLMLVKFGSQFDTFPISYHYDCTQELTTLDLTDFKNGSQGGKTLFGLIEWSNDSVFRYDAEFGSSPDARPKTLNMEHADRYFREKG